MLAASAPDPTAAVGKTGLPAVVDHKLDGIRVQVHRAGDAISIYTRSLDDITGRLPEVVAVVAALPQRQLVLDGEVLGIGADGRPLTFQVSASRTMTRLDKGDPAAGERTPLSLFCFDLLHVDGRDLLDEPLSERIAVMARAAAGRTARAAPGRRHHRRGERGVRRRRHATASRGWW